MTPKLLDSDDHSPALYSEDGRRKEAEKVVRVKFRGSLIGYHTLNLSKLKGVLGAIPIPDSRSLFQPSNGADVLGWGFFMSSSVGSTIQVCGALYLNAGLPHSSVYGLMILVLIGVI